MDEAARLLIFQRKLGIEATKYAAVQQKQFAQEKISQQEESEIYQQTPGVHWPDLGCERAITWMDSRCASQSVVYNPVTHVINP